MNDISSRIGGWVIALLIGAGLGAFVMHRIDADNPVTITKTLLQKLPVKVPVPAAPALEVADVGKAPIPIKQIIAYKPEAKKKLNMPKDIQDASQQKVISASTVEPDEHPQTVTTVLDTATGESQVLVQAEPLPWLAVDHHGDAGAFVGYKGGVPTARLETRQGLIQVKALHVGLMASADQPLNGGRADLFGGIGAWARW